MKTCVICKTEKGHDYFIKKGRVCLECVGRSCAKTKRCAECKEVFKLDKFFNNKNGLLGKNSLCKECFSIKYTVRKKQEYQSGGSNIKIPCADCSKRPYKQQRENPCKHNTI